MINNYMSTAGMQPDNGWKPQGFLGGLQYANQEQDYASQLGLSNLTSMLGIMKQKNEQQDYQANEPVRQAERGAKIVGFQSDELAAPSETQARITKANVTNKYAMSEAENKDWEGRHKKTIAATEDIGNRISGLLSSGLAPPEVLMQWNKMVPQLEKEYGPGMPEWAKNITDPKQLIQMHTGLVNSLGHLRAQAIERMKEEAADKRNRETIQGHIDVEKIREKWHMAAQARDKSTAAAEKAKITKEWIEAEEYNIANREAQKRGVDPKQFSLETKADIQNAARRRVFEAQYGSNPQGKAAGVVEQKGGEADVKETNRERLMAEDLPKNRKDWRNGVVYRRGNDVGRWNEKTGQFDDLTFPKPSGMQGDQVIR